MSMRASWHTLVLVVLCWGVGACGDAGASRVDYTSGKPKGRWFSDADVMKSEPQTQTQAMQMQDGVSADAGEPSESKKLTDSEAAQGGAPADVQVVRAGAGGAPGSDASAQAGSSGSRAQAGAGGASAPSAKVTLSFTTVTQHMGKGNASCGKGEDGMSYGPCNLGAVWVTTPDGKLVKIISVWGKSTYTKHLVRYQSVRAGMRPDVVAAATLKTNEAHAVTWDHTDMMMQPAPLGAYKLIVEVADADTMSVPNGMNAMLELSFDTQKRTQVSAADMAYYTNIELRYE